MGEGYASAFQKKINEINGETVRSWGDWPMIGN